MMSNNGTSYFNSKIKTVIPPIAWTKNYLLHGRKTFTLYPPIAYITCYNENHRAFQNKHQP